MVGVNSSPTAKSLIIDHFLMDYALEIAFWLAWSIPWLIALINIGSFLISSTVFPFIPFDFN